jgi:hypothetical protein
MASLGDEEIVRRWIRALSPKGDQQVNVRRTWGARLFARGSGQSRCSSPTGSVLGWQSHLGGQGDLTPEQVEHVVIDAPTSTQRPTWPEWSALL